jgi:hypothetical protein
VALQPENGNFRFLDLSTNDVLGAIGMHLQIAPLEKIKKSKRKNKAA